MLSTVALLTAFVTAPPTVLISETGPSQAQAEAIAHARNLTDPELEKLKLFRLSSDEVTVVVTTEAFPFREYDALCKGLAEVGRGSATKGLFTFSSDSGGVLTAMIRGGAQKQLAIMPRIRLVIEVDNVRKVVGTERADIHLSYPVVTNSVKPSTTPPDIWPRLPSSVAPRLQLQFQAEPHGDVTEARGFSIAMRRLDEEVSRCLTAFSNVYRSLFLSARESDPDHFGNREIVPGGISTLPDSMIDVIAMQLESDPAFKGMDRAAVKAKVREGRIVKVVRGIFSVSQRVGASGGRSATLRELPIPEPPQVVN